MNKTEFIKSAAKEIKEFLPPDMAEAIEIEPVQIVRMNDQKFNGLRFHSSDDSPQPTIYLDQAYENLCRGEPAEDIFRTVADSYIKARDVSAVPHLTDYAYEKVKDKLGLRLIELDRSREFLKKVPSMDVGNGLAVICDIRFSGHGPN